MKKLFMAAVILMLISGVSMSAVETKGALVIPSAQTYSGLYTAEATIWENDYPLGIYTNRAFSVKNSAASQTINATLEASINGLDWATIEASALLGITAGKTVMTTVLLNPAPYWRIRAAGGPSIATTESSASMTAN